MMGGHFPCNVCDFFFFYFFLPKKKKSLLVDGGWMKFHLIFQN